MDVKNSLGLAGAALFLLCCSSGERQGTMASQSAAQGPRSQQPLAEAPTLMEREAEDDNARREGETTAPVSSTPGPDPSPDGEVKEEAKTAAAGAGQGGDAPVVETAGKGGQGTVTMGAGGSSGNSGAHLPGASGSANTGGQPQAGVPPNGDSPAGAPEQGLCDMGPPTPTAMAFPGAEGFGAQTPAGRGGQVLEVTQLDDSGAGSLRAAIDQAGPRTIVFRVSGTISLRSDLVVTEPNLTIAGQTAPGDGVALRNHKFVVAANDVVVRHLRFRRGRDNDERDDALAIEEAENVVIDHCSMSWGTDETLNTWHGSKNITVQWSLVSEALHHNSHGFAATLGGVNASYHHLLFANCPGRNPSIAGNGEHQTHNLDFRNSVIFNFGHRTFDGKPSSINIVGNYFKPGPNSTETHFAEIDEAGVYDAIPTTAWYLSDNFWEGNAEISNNNAAGTKGAVQWLVEQPNEFAPVATVSAMEAYDLVLDGAGATLPKRDGVDLRIVSEVRSGTPTYGDGVVLDPSDVGGWPELNSVAAPADTDHDGIPDDWEQEHGLNPADESDGRQLQANGYSNLEHYLHCMHQ